MRSQWFQYVAKVRKKLQRKAGKKTTVTHKMAMSEASKTWGKEKLKIERRILREKKKIEKEVKESKKSEAGLSADSN